MGGIDEGIGWSDGRERRREKRTNDIFLCAINQSQSESCFESNPGLSVHVPGIFTRSNRLFTRNTAGASSGPRPGQHKSFDDQEISSSIMKVEDSLAFPESATPCPFRRRRTFVIDHL